MPAAHFLRRLLLFKGTSEDRIKAPSPMAEIPFWVHDRPKWVSGITRTTTCQDVLQSLVLAERKSNKASSSSTQTKKDTKASTEDAREYSKGLALVEQWRGVERPLSNTSRILKLWLAWGEERSQVKFVVKRISSSSLLEARGGKTSTLPSQSRTRKTRRRNSRASVTSQCNSERPHMYKKTDTVHPNVLKKKQSQIQQLGHQGQPIIGAESDSQSDLERLMRIILTQGETIHWQLKKLQQREGQIDNIEQQVHDSRTRIAGKDYLLNAYLTEQTAAGGSGSNKKNSSIAEALDSHNIPDSLQGMLDGLTKVFSLNEKIKQKEEEANELHCQLSVGQEQQKEAAADTKPADLKGMHSELSDLRNLNDQCGHEIDYNRHLITSMRSAFDERKALVAKLEQDVDNIESEGHRLQEELRALQQKRQEHTLELLSHVETMTNDDIDSRSEESADEPILFADAAFLRDDDHGHFTITNEQLYDGQQEPGALYNELQRRLHIKTSGLEELSSLQHPLPRMRSPDTTRINATGSPGSASSSGNSSGSGASYEKSVRFSDREMILSTPDLPALPPVPSNNKKPHQQQQQVATTKAAKAKSILKPVEGSTGVNGANNGDTDSNSDTGLSSLHSSSDEGTYVLDTLV